MIVRTSLMTVGFAPYRSIVRISGMFTPSRVAINSGVSPLMFLVFNATAPISLSWQTMSSSTVACAKAAG
jgi:hypothetical protein